MPQRTFPRTKSDLSLKAVPSVVVTPAVLCTCSEGGWQIGTHCQLFYDFQSGHIIILVKYALVLLFGCLTAGGVLKRNRSDTIDLLISFFSIGAKRFERFVLSCRFWVKIIWVGSRPVNSHPRLWSYFGYENLYSPFIHHSPSKASTEVWFCTLWPCDLDLWPFDLILNG